MTTAGIDFDTHAVHVVLLDDDGAATYYRVDLEGHDAFERTRAVGRNFPHWIRSAFPFFDVIACGIEEPQGISKSTVAKLKAIQGAIIAALPQELLVQPFQPAQWRKAVGLPGGAEKAHVTWFCEKRGWIPPGQDAADAYCLALAVQRLAVAA